MHQLLLWPAPQITKSPWRNRLARLTVNQKVGGSSPPGDVQLFPPIFQTLLIKLTDFVPFTFPLVQVTYRNSNRPIYKVFVIGKDEDIPNCPKCKSPVSTKTSIDPRENVTPPKVSGDIGTPSRPRDSPNRYDFRKVPAIPLISEKADSEGEICHGILKIILYRAKLCVFF